MTVYKRGKKGVFYMNFTVNGERVFKSTGKFTKKEAKLVEAVEKKKLMEEAALSPQEKSAKMLLSEAIEQVYQGKWKNNKDGKGTHARAHKLITYIGNIPLGKINDDAVYQLAKKLDALNVQPSTVNRYFTILKTILRYKRQPWDHIKLRKERKGRIRSYSFEEEKEIIDLLKNTDHPKRRYYYHEVGELVEVLIDTGMRLGEVLNLRSEDINFETNLITIWINKGDRPRSIPMTSRVKEVLKRKCADNREKPFSIGKDRVEWAWKWVRQQMNMTEDKDFVIHTLRHTCATRLVNGGIDLYVVKEWLGHSSIQVTERYAHLSPKKLVHAAKILEK